ncbi:MAG: DUF2892 domain-containing protein [Syntrophomonadaceae bacterium]|nr:DUF2892 domain-containing protein [Syntrophomonadaceae bacterium]
MNLEFKRNLGNIDRAIRITIGFILLFLPAYIQMDTTWNWLFYILGIINIAEGTFAY